MSKMSECDLERHSTKLAQFEPSTSPLLSTSSPSIASDSCHAENALPGRRQQLETLLEKTDEDECFIPVATGTTSSPLGPALLAVYPTPLAANTSHHRNNDFKPTTTTAAAKFSPVSYVHHRRTVATITAALFAVSCTTSSTFVQGFALPLLAIFTSWCFLQRIWSGSQSRIVSLSELCAYACMGECVGWCFTSLLPDYIRTFIVLLSIGLLLKLSSCVSSTRRISVFILFIAVCRAAAVTVVILPASLTPFLVYGLGVVVEVFVERIEPVHNGKKLSLEEEDSCGVAFSLPAFREDSTVPIGGRLSDEASVSLRQRRRSIMSSTSSDRILPSCYSPLTSARGRRTSLPSLSMNRHRESKKRRGRDSIIDNCILASDCQAKFTLLPSSPGARRSFEEPKLTDQHSSGSMPSYEAAVIAEAHGIITDMLSDGTLLPPHIASGLRAVATLLEQPGVGCNTPSSASGRMKNGPFVSLSEVTSDTEESPFTGERPNVLPKAVLKEKPIQLMMVLQPKNQETFKCTIRGSKLIVTSQTNQARFRRSLPLSLLRRMSTSTWTTTTSATGLPTLEAEPSRKRSTSFRHSPVSSPGGSRSHSPSPAVSPNPRDSSLGTIIQPKQRSLSTIIPLRGSPSPSSSSRKYHRSTIGSISVPEGSFSKSVTFNLEPSSQRADAEKEEARPAERHLSPAIRRINLTSDYESSESPSNSEYDESGTMLDDSSASTIQAEPLVPEESELTGEDEEVQDLLPGRHFRVGNITYDLESVEDHHLLNHLSEWDFPVFDLYNEMGDRILSQMAYKVFSDVGLFETFKIPVQEFLNYFHTLEMGYRDKPYHNRIHAADVLHGVYFLSSQPIPGFVQTPWHEMPKSPKPRASTADLASVGQALPNLRLQYANGSAEDDIYGIMGCNLPPLELMAMYTAAAMHDYDHPGRTNAFLVATSAPQAILYNDRSVLENHHAAAAWRLLLSKPEFNWLCHLEKPEFKRFRYLVIEAILATDLKRHFELIAEFNSKASDDDAPGLDWTNETDRLMASQMCIKLADINGPCKRKDLHLQWTYRITEEFFEQGDEEASLGMPISPYMDRKNSQLARLQESFINHLVAPLCNAYSAAGLFPGRWTIYEEPDDSSPETTRKTSLEIPPGSQIPEDTEAEDPPAPTDRIPLPRIECVLMEHLKSNHEMWAVKVKEEELLKAEKADWDARPSRKNSTADQP